jgi:hypothetical protein
LAIFSIVSRSTVTGKDFRLSLGCHPKKLRGMALANSFVSVKPTHLEKMCGCHPNHLTLSPSRHRLSIWASSPEPDKHTFVPVNNPPRRDYCRQQNTQAQTIAAVGMDCGSSARPNWMPPCKTKGLHRKSEEVQSLLFDMLPTS